MTTDGGLGWTDTTANGLPGRYVTDLAVNPEDAAEAWATLSGFGLGHVFHTDEYGATWTDISGYLPDAPRERGRRRRARLAPRPFRRHRRRRARLVHRRRSLGEEGGGLPNTVVTDLLTDRTANRLLAATYGRGLWAEGPEAAGLSG